MGSILWQEDTFWYRLDNMSARTDRELAQAYAELQDEAAFAELVSRHQGLVFQSCMRMLSNAHDAQEAAQSVFIVLSRKARSLRREGALNGWLHDVARKVCLKALRLRAREAEKETDAMMWQESEKVASSSETDSEALLGWVDRELAGLSTVMREAVLLRHMQGYSEKAAAEMAGCPVGTLSRRASEGIAKLRGRLAKRGITLAATALTAALEAEAQAAIPETLLSSTMTAVKVYAAGGAASATVSANVAVLTKGVLNMMFWNSVKISVVVAVGVAAVAGGGVAAHRAMETYSANERRDVMKEVTIGDEIEKARKAGKSVHVFTGEDKTQMEVVFREVVTRFGRQNVTIMDLSLDDSTIPDSDIVVGRWTNFGFAYARQAIMENHRADVDGSLAKTHCVIVGVDDVVLPCVISTKVDGVQKILASVSFADLTNKYGSASRIPQPSTTSTDQAL